MIIQKYQHNPENHQANDGFLMDGTIRNVEE
jgi:hypothetical protein